MATKGPDFSIRPVIVSDTGPTNFRKTAIISIALVSAGVFWFLVASGFFSKLIAATFTLLTAFIAKKTLTNPRIIKKIVGSDLVEESQKWPHEPKIVKIEPLSKFLGVQLAVGPNLDPESDGLDLTEVILVHPNEEFRVTMYAQDRYPHDLSDFSRALSSARIVQAEACSYPNIDRLPDLDRRDWRQTRPDIGITKQSGLEWILERIQIAEEEGSITGVRMLRDLARNDKSLAESYLARALKLCTRVGPEHPETGQLFEEIGDRHFSRSGYKRAAKAYESALSIIRKHSAKPHDTIDLRLKLADTFRLDSEFEDARVLYRNILTPAFQPSIRGSYLALITERYAYVLRRLGHEDAKKISEEAKRLKAMYPGK